VKPITAASICDLIAKVYKAEGWTHRVGDVKIKRVQTVYDVRADHFTNRWCAFRMRTGLERSK